MRAYLPLFLASSLALAAPTAPAPTPTPAPASVDDGLTPAERYAAGNRLFGVYAVQDAKACSPSAATKAMGGLGFPPEFTLGTNALGQPITAGGYVESQRRTLQQALEVFKSKGDTDVAGRHICTGLFSFGDKGPNAVAMPQGYIAADPRLTDLVNALPNRTMFSLDMIFVHELAHQFQYWYGTPFEKDARDRRSELSADCMAAATISLRWTEPWVLKEAAQGVISMAVSVGDLEYEAKGHHGTPEERALAASTGVALALEALEQSRFPTSRQLLNACTTFVIEKDKEGGPNWKIQAPPPAQPSSSPVQATPAPVLRPLPK